MDVKNNGILSTIGHTPLVHLRNIYKESSCRFYAKLEMFNPGGSMKDRPALMMLSKAFEEGNLRKGATVIESSSGNMAIGLAQACRYWGLHLVVVVDPKINHHTLRILQTYGAQIEPVEHADAQGNYLSARLERVQELLDGVPGSYWPNQYANKYNPAAHVQTMREIVKSQSAAPDYLLVATSTCGTLMGCANYIQQHALHTKIVAVDAAGSVIFGKPPADRLVPGYGSGRHSDLLENDAVDRVLHISDQECIMGCRRLLNREAILAGGSSGAVVMAAGKLQYQIPEGSTCALILADSGERYLDTLFNDEWVKDHLGDSEPQEARDNIQIPAPISTIHRKKRRRKIAIIGGGPKGMFGFERLAARLKAHPPQEPMEIHVYNRTAHFGAGDIYRPHQPSYLLINNPIGDINMWIDEDPPPVISAPLSLTQWLRRKRKKDVSSHDYVSRGATGRYLSKGFQQIATNLPEGVRGQYLVGEITNICREGDQYAVKLKTDAGITQDIPHRYDHILLATGHPKNQATPQEKKFQQFTENVENTGFIPFIYPVKPTLTNIPAGCKVAVKGTGLTFVDAMLAMTQGKGGSFQRHEASGKLIYNRSGREPQVIHPFSRSGLPMLPRGPASYHKKALKFFTNEKLETLQNQQSPGKVDFKEHLWPLLRQEFIFAFYDIEMKQKGFKDDLAACDSFPEVQHYIKLFHEQFPRLKRFDPCAFLKPLNHPPFCDGTSFHASMQSYLTFFLQEAQKGEMKSPWAAVTSVWRKANPVFGALYAFGGLTPSSQRYFDTQFRRLLQRVTFGPPVKSAEKLLALMEEGLLNFDLARNPSISMDQKNGTFMLASDHPENQRSVHYLVDARISKISVTDNLSPLYQNMLHRGLISMYENCSGQHSYQPGCIDLSKEGFVIDKQGNTNPALAVTGTPTEGITFDNDALSPSRNNFVSNWAAYIFKKYAKVTVANYAF